MKMKTLKVTNCLKGYFWEKDRRILNKNKQKKPVSNNGHELSEIL